MLVIYYLCLVHEHFVAKKQQLDSSVLISKLKTEQPPFLKLGELSTDAGRHLDLINDDEAFQYFLLEIAHTLHMILMSDLWSSLRLRHTWLVDVAFPL